MHAPAPAPSPDNGPPRSRAPLVVAVIVGLIVALNLIGIAVMMRVSRAPPTPPTAADASVHLPAPQGATPTPRPAALQPAPPPGAADCDVPREDESFDAYQARCPSSSAAPR